MVDGPSDATKEELANDLKGRFFPSESSSEHIMSFAPNNEIHATTILLDVKSVFTMLKRRALYSISITEMYWRDFFEYRR